MSVHWLWKISLIDGNWTQLSNNYIRLDVSDFASKLSALMIKNFILFFTTVDVSQQERCSSDFSHDGDSLTFLQCHHEFDICGSLTTIELIAITL